MSDLLYMSAVVQIFIYGAAGNSGCCQAGPCIMAPVSLTALTVLTHDQGGYMGWTFLCG